MIVTRLRHGLAVPALAFALVACGGGSTGLAPAGGTGQPSSSGAGGSTGSGGGTGSTGSTGGATHAGMGDSTAAPTGQAWSWPPALRVDDPVKGDDPFCVPPEQPATPPVGHGGLVRVCVGFHNTGLVPITVTLPPGLVFVSNSLESQNGLVLTETTIVVPVTSTTFYVPVYAYCLNLGRHNTAGAQDTYRAGPLTDDASVLELLALLQGRQVTPAFDFKLQQILWDITENGGLTQEDRDAIAAL